MGRRSILSDNYPICLTSTFAWKGIYTNVPGYPGVGPYYFNTHYANGYTTYGQIIGSWIGRQGDGIQAWSTYWFSGQKKIQLGYRRQYDRSYLPGWRWSE